MYGYDNLFPVLCEARAPRHDTDIHAAHDLHLKYSCGSRLRRRTMRSGDLNINRYMCHIKFRTTFFTGSCLRFLLEVDNGPNLVPHVRGEWDRSNSSFVIVVTYEYVDVRKYPHVRVPTSDISSFRNLVPF